MGFDRRSFISLVVGGAVGTTLTPVIWKTLDDVSIWSQNWSWIPRLKYGEEKKHSAICKLGSDAYGIKVKTIAGNPVVAEGDPNHPLSLGGICPLGAASVQLLYSPSRISNPKVKDGNTFKDISWEEAEELLAEKIKSAGSNMAMISGDDTGSVTDILAGLVGKAGSKNAFLMPGESAPAARALSFLGGDGQVGYDLENSDYILMLGADVLGSWGNVARNGKAFAASREEADYVYVGPAQTGTAAVADNWIPCSPGTEAVLALGLAGAIIANGGGSPFWSGFSEFAQFVRSNYSLETVAEITAVPVETIKELAQSLTQAKAPLVLAAAGASQGLGVFEAAAGMCLNMLLGCINETGGVRVLPWNPRVIDAAMERKNLLANDLVAYLSAIADGSVSAPSLLMIYGANPAHSLPNLTKTLAALDKADFVVSFSSFMDETAVLADLIMPDSYGFERLDDSYSPYGASQPIYTVTAPIIKPVYDTKPTGDVLLSVASVAGLDLGFASFEEVVQAKAEALDADYDEMIEEGVAWVGTEFPAQDLAFWSTPLRKIEIPHADGQFLTLAPVTRLKIGSSKLATPPFGTNAIRYDELYGREMYIQVNGATAKSLGLVQNDAVKLTSSSGECRARLRIFEGVTDNTVVAPLGFGHTAWDNFSRGKGDNVFKLLSASTEEQTGASRFATVQVMISKA